MIYKLPDKKAKVHDLAWVAKNATVIGDVKIDEGVSVFFNSVIRGDSDEITIGSNTNVQDNCTLHCDEGYPLQIGSYVTIGHQAIVHGAIIHDHVMIGMGSIIMNGAIVESNCIIGAGALVSEGMHIPQGSIAVGMPAKIVKATSDKQREKILNSATHYCIKGEVYKKEGL